MTVGPLEVLNFPPALQHTREQLTSVPPPTTRGTRLLAVRGCGQGDAEDALERLIDQSG